MMASYENDIFSYREASHKSVMRNEVLQALDLNHGGVFVDATFGAGGHTRAILESEDCIVVGVDRDPYTKVFADKITSDYPKRFHYVNARFSDLKTAIADSGFTQVNGVLFDLGVSSMQIDTPRRGFSFSNDGPLDMRMNDMEGRSAEELVNEAEEEDLAGIIFKYGGERMSRRIASAIVAARVSKPIKRTAELSSIIRGAVGKYNDSIDPATRTFQALRIWVNDELDEVMMGLGSAEKILSPGGRIAVISFHSGEDKIVKDFLKERSGGASGSGVSRYAPEQISSSMQPTFKIETKKAIVPSGEEIEKNPRARSAKLRCATRTDAPDWNGGIA